MTVNFNQLPPATLPLTGNEILALNQGNVTKKVTASELQGSAGGVTSVNGATGIVVLNAASVGAVPVARTISVAGTGLSGGGDLSADRTITLTPSALPGNGNIGYLDIPQNHQAGNYGIIADDDGKQIYHELLDGPATWTLPSNAGLPLPVGFVATFINMDTSAVTITITTDTLLLAGPGTTGARTLARFGIATAVKITPTSWIINGVNLT